MGNTVIKTNEVRVDGIVHTVPEYSHSIMGEQFFQFELAARRKSGAFDYVPVTVSERAFDLDDIVVGTKILVIGSFRSFNKQTEQGHKLLLSVFAAQLCYLKSLKDENKIWMLGTICKPTVYRTTPYGREITDLILGVNRDYNKSDYIPCIAWGRNAVYAGKLPVGTRLCVRGRIQSREYRKKLTETESEMRVAYEVSLYSLNLAEQLEGRI